MSTPREIEGRWWLPTKPDEVWFGKLVEDADGRLTLTTQEMKSLTMAEIFKGDFRLKTEPLICGRDAGDKPVSLLHCNDYGTHGSFGMFTRKIGGAFALLGFEAEAQDKVRFSRVLADFTHLQAWLDLSCLSHEEEDGTTQISYRYPKDVPFTLADGTRVTIRAKLNSKFSGKGFGGWSETKYEFSEQRHLEFAFPQPLRLTEIITRILSIRWLLTLLVSRPVHLTKLTALLPDVLDEGKPEQSIEVLGSHLDRSESPKSPHPSEMLASFAEVQPTFVELLDRWRDYHHRLAAVLPLYFSIRFNDELYSNHRFLFLAQALEVYHAVTSNSAIAPTAEYKARLKRVLESVPEEDREWVGEGLRFANKKTLAQRLDEILGRHPTEAARIVGDMLDFADKIRHTRNYYTHFEERLKKLGKVASDAEIILLTERMQRLLEVCFLKDLGLDGGPVRKVVGKPLPRVVMVDLQ